MSIHNENMVSEFPEDGLQAGWEWMDGDYMYNHPAGVWISIPGFAANTQMARDFLDRAAKLLKEHPNDGYASHGLVYYGSAIDGDEKVNQGASDKGYHANVACVEIYTEDFPKADAEKILDQVRDNYTYPVKSE